MDKRFDKLNNWLLFELICTFLTLLWTIRAISELRVYGSGMTQWEEYLFYGVILLVLRIFFLGRAWWSFIPGSSKDESDDKVNDPWAFCETDYCSNKVALGKNTKYCAVHINSDGE